MRACVEIRHCKSRNSNLTSQIRSNFKSLLLHLWNKKPDHKLVFKSHRTRLANHSAFLPALQTIYKFILKPAVPVHSILVSALTLWFLSEREKTFAAPRLPKRSFYHKAHLVKLTPLQVTLQTSPFKQTSCTHIHSCAAKWPKCLLLSLSFTLPSFLAFIGPFCPFCPAHS